MLLKKKIRSLKFMCNDEKLWQLLYYQQNLNLKASRFDTLLTNVQHLFKGIQLGESKSKYYVISEMEREYGGLWVCSWQYIGGKVSLSQCEGWCKGLYSPSFLILQNKPTFLVRSKTSIIRRCQNDQSWKIDHLEL